MHRNRDQNSKALDLMDNKYFVKSINLYNKRLLRFIMFLLGILISGIVSGCGLQMDDELSSANVIQPTSFQEEEVLSKVPELPHDPIPYTITGDGEVSAVVEQVMPAVVAINGVIQYETKGLMGRSRTFEGTSSGSGIIIGENHTELLIVTNHHVLDGAVLLEVTFIDDEVAEAHIKGTDAENDLAVIAVRLKEIPNKTKEKIAIGTLGNSDLLKAGQGVIAIGNALGYGQSVTLGYISAVNREVQTDAQTVRTLIQTDAAINPGNSGGALLNMQGEIIGINSAKIAVSGVEGMGYAIPITGVKDSIDELMTCKTRIFVEQDQQGYFGIHGRDTDSWLFALLDIPCGVFVYKIQEGEAAAVSGLKEEDIITKIDGQGVKSVEELEDLLVYYAAGERVEVTIQSLQDEEYVESQVTVILGNRPRGKSGGEWF